MLPRRARKLILYIRTVTRNRIDIEARKTSDFEPPTKKEKQRKTKQKKGKKANKRKKEEKKEKRKEKKEGLSLLCDQRGRLQFWGSFSLAACQLLGC